MVTDCRPPALFVRCPKCGFEGRVAQEVPVVPAALGIFDCPACLQAFVLARLEVGGPVKVVGVTRTGATRASA